MEALIGGTDETNLIDRLTHWNYSGINLKTVAPIQPTPMPTLTPLTSEALIAELGLDPQSPQHLYLQVSQGLARLIRSQRFPANAALPSERTLADKLGISRITARKAIDALVAEGLVERRHGSGNFISPRLEQPLTRLSTFSEELSARGFIPRSKWLRRFIGIAQAEEIVGFGLPAGSRVARLERVRLADDTPMAVEFSALPIDVVSQPEAVGDSLYVYLKTLGHEPVRALQHLRATNATPRQSELLGIPPGEALLFTTRFAYAADGRPIEITHTWCRSDYYDYVVELHR